MTLPVTMKRPLLSLTIALLLPHFLLSQTAGRPFAIGLWGGLTQYNGDLGQGFYNSKGQDAQLHIGLTTSWFISSHFDFSMNATLGTLGYYENQVKNFEADHLQWNSHIRASLFKEERFKINPYGFVGIGLGYMNNIKRPGTDLFIPFGAGLKISLTERLGMLLQETFAYTDHDNRDKEEKKDNDAFLMHSLGLTWNFSCEKDEDKDGVADKKDKCPQTPAGTAVNSDGCPLDRDGDGIPDLTDACPEIKGVASAKGCPDKDGDSVADSIDKCIEVAGLVSANPLLNGCPDKDEDGVTDADDRCPELKGTAELKGCPDRDGDQVADPDDQCPDSAGTTANKGCPEQLAPAVPAQTAPALPVVYFETGKYAFGKAYNSKLDEVARMMNENPAITLAIKGYTDSTGSKEKNMELSQQRADFVKVYLVKKGIAENRLVSQGYGDSSPVGDNSSAAGRAKNRRVEIAYP